MMGSGRSTSAMSCSPASTNVTTSSARGGAAGADCEGDHRMATLIIVALRGCARCVITLSRPRKALGTPRTSVSASVTYVPGLLCYRCSRLHRASGPLEHVVMRIEGGTMLKGEPLFPEPSLSRCTYVGSSHCPANCCPMNVFINSSARFKSAPAVLTKLWGAPGNGSS
jgi:hypothetical protein